ncbi:hypothetical protein [Chryseobacterium sp. SL1]|uniref:hypothetical protein n=1 Tax=Chryseobacterium sp. SL1 TaxID=2995159 RepID=UPI0022759B54|nr:hypothetical protein [Chryseobacterium sp. SL1]MCY1660878.1 hypothetical protein [Chryseobacterium sp. SL1]
MDYNQIILDEKEKLNNLLKSFLSSYNNTLDEKSIQEIVNDLVIQFSNLLSKTNKCISDCHQKNDFFYNKDLRNDFKATVENYLEISFKLIDLIQFLVEKYSLTKISFKSTSFVLIQKFINTFFSKEEKNTYINEFKKRDIDLKGFEIKFKKLKTKYLQLQLIIGLPLLILTSGMVFFGEKLIGNSFNGIQLILTKALIALSISIVGSSLIEGQVETKWSLAQGITIRAIGWIAIFLLLYYINPANPGDVY